MSEETRPEENRPAENMPEENVPGKAAPRNVDAGPAEVEAEAAAPEGQYVEGDYGSAGTAGEVPPTAVEGEYAAGDYGEAGVAGAAVVGDVEGDYPEGDYGEGGVSGEPAGVAGESAGVAEEGEYPEGDYGTAGTSRPERSARPAAGEPADERRRSGRQLARRKLAGPAGAGAGWSPARVCAAAGLCAQQCRFAQGETLPGTRRKGWIPGNLGGDELPRAGRESKVESMSLNFELTYVRVWVKLSVDRSITVGPLRLRSHCGSAAISARFQGSKEAIHVTCSRY